MKRTKKVIVAMILVGIVIVGYVYGTQKSQKEEPITITAMVRDFGRDKTQYIDKLYEKYTNVHIEWEIIPFDKYPAVLDQRLASGELPDMFEIDRQKVDQFYDKAVFLNFKDYLEQMPNRKKWMQKIPSIYYNSADAKGNMYCLDSFNTRGAVPCMPIYRKDIFEKENIKVPKTMDELYDALVALKTKYPDSVPIVNRWGANNLIDNVAMLYQCRTGFYLDNKDLVYKYGPMTENFKAAIQTLRKFYAAGLIDKEFATTSGKQFEERIISGKAFFLPAEYMCCLNTEDEGNWTGRGKEYNPDFELSPMAPPITEFGQGLVDVQEPSNLGHYSVAVNAKSKYIDEIVKLLDDQLSDEIINLVNWGVEGETYEVINGEKRWLIDYEERQKKGLDSRSGMWVPIDTDCKEKGLHEKDTAFCREANSKVEQYGFYRAKTVLSFRMEEKEKMKAITTPLYEYCNAQCLKFIVGELNMEEDWDSFLRTLTDMGYETVLEMYQKKYEELPEERKGLNTQVGI